jgi:hypothetical protein
VSLIKQLFEYGTEALQATKEEPTWEGSL